MSQEVMLERDRYKAELVAMKDRNPDDLYLPQIKEVCFSQNGKYPCTFVARSFSLPL